MEKFQQVIFKLAENHPNAPLTPSARALLQDRLTRFVSQYKTPDHPPYSALIIARDCRCAVSKRLNFQFMIPILYMCTVGFMIERAIRELNEKRGSSEDSISRFLEKEYDYLPWAHSTILKHHLRNLCESGVIVATNKKRYKLAGETEIPVLNSPSTKKVKKRQPLRIKLRIPRKAKKEVIQKYQELHYEEEQQSTIENGGLAAAYGNICSEVSLEHQKIGQSEIMKAERQQLEYSRPENSMCPGFGSTRDENLLDLGLALAPTSVEDSLEPELAERQQSEYTHHETPKLLGLESTRDGNLLILGQTQPEQTSAEELFESERARRQLKRWKLSYPEPKSVTMTPIDHPFDANRTIVKQMPHENDLKSLGNHVELSGDKKYSRRRKTRSEQSEIIVTDLSIKAIQAVDIQSEKESQELLQQTPARQQEIFSADRTYSRRRKTRSEHSETIVTDLSIKANQAVDVQSHKEPQEPIQQVPPQHEKIFIGDEKYHRKRKTRSKQPENTVTDLPIKEKEPHELLLQQTPPQHKEVLQEKKQPRRSLRIRLAKPEVTKDESFVIALPSQQHCREDCPGTMKPPEQKPANQQQVPEPVHLAGKDMTEPPDKPSERRRGRPPKCLCAGFNKDMMQSPDGPEIVVMLAQLEFEDPGRLPKRRGRGRPPKVNAG
ncbi:hypothetical protein OROMI_009915 [Orobanche minor]